jgi:hypothetical protein
MSQWSSARDQQGLIERFEALGSDVGAEITKTVKEKCKVDGNRNS